MHRPRLSVIVPVYKTEDTLNRCIRSVVSQSFADWELILVDDGSPDNCPEICDEWAQRDDRIRVIHKNNGGLSDARNHGIDVAKSGCLTFLDSDDELAAGTLLPLMKMMDENPTYDVLEYGVSWNKGHNCESQISFSERTYAGFEEYWSEGSGFTHCWAWNKIFRAPLFNNLRFKKGIVFEDVEFMGRLLLLKPVIHTTTCGQYIYYYNKDGISKRYDESMCMLLLNQLEIVNRYGLNLNEHRWHYLYMTMLHTQIDLYILTRKIILPYAKIAIRKYNTKSSVFKAFMLRTIGLKNTLRFFAFLKTRR